EDAVRRSQTMRAARQQAPPVVAAAYRNAEALGLRIDGLQPEQGHETLSVVRELNAKRMWCAEALQQGGGGAPSADPGAGMGHAVGPASPPMVVGQTRCVRHRDRGRGSRGPASVWRQS